MFSVPGAYDRAITVFSPDGRLFQVEYASETVKRGATVLGIACPDGVILAAEERATSKLQDPTFMWKIFQIDEHVGAAVAGLSCERTSSLIKQESTRNLTGCCMTNRLT